MRSEFVKIMTLVLTFMIEINFNWNFFEKGLPLKFKDMQRVHLPFFLFKLFESNFSFYDRKSLRIVKYHKISLVRQRNPDMVLENHKNVSKLQGRERGRRVKEVLLQ